MGRCRLLGRLGAGGMGVVYLAEHPQAGLVAVKTPHAAHLADPTLRARFAEEVVFSRRVVPFCTAAVIEDGLDHDRPYLVTEYIPGPALSLVVPADGPLAPDLAYGVALGTAAALTAVHEAGLVHRDLKPANVLLSPRGPFVIDFGIARDLDTVTALTQTGQIMGSPGWVAPERLSGGRALPVSDVFSWGCLVVYAATGRHPFGGGDLDALTRRILAEEPRTEGVRGPLLGLVTAALRKDPAERPDAAALLSALLTVHGVVAPDDPRRAVGRVLADLWRPVPYPVSACRPSPGRRTAGADGVLPAGSAMPAGSSPRASGGHPGPGERRTRERGMAEHGHRAAGRGARHRATRNATADGQAGNAGFAALATIAIAALTIVAASTGAARLRGVFEPPPAATPSAVPWQDDTYAPEEAIGTPGRGPGTTRPPVAVSHAPAPPRPHARMTATSAAVPARSARNGRRVVVASPTPVTVTFRPSPRPERCTVRDCDLPPPRSPAPPPSSGPRGDGESPPASPSPPAPEPSPESSSPVTP